MGASIRTSLAAKARARSSARLEMRLTRTPTAGLTSYLVTDGPISARSTVTLIPKLAKVSSKILIFSRTIFFSLDWSLVYLGQRVVNLEVYIQGLLWLKNQPEHLRHQSLLPAQGIQVQLEAG